jgi:succinoglycan biosynthesis protein ExoA
MDIRPLISVVLPIRNEARPLPALLASLMNQDFPASDFEIIVADGRSTDGTRDLVRRFAAESSIAVTLIDNPAIRSASGRNAGLRAARGEFVLFIDGHCHIPSNRLLRDTLFLFEETRADCLCRPQPLLAPIGSGFGAAVAAVRASTLGQGRDSLIYDMTISGFVDPASSGAAYRRSVFATIGTYDERFDACEDVELNMRVRKSGIKSYTDPRLAVFYEPRTSLQSLIKQMLRYGRGRVRLMMRHPDCISAGQIAPAILVAWIIVALVLLTLRVPALAWPRWWLVAPLVLYAGAVLASSMNLARKSDFKLLYQAPPIYCSIHIGLGVGIWAEALRCATSFLTRKPWVRSKSEPNIGIPRNAGRHSAADET